MKQFFLIITALLAMATGAKADVEINSENFPDANFRSYLLSQDYGKDGIITDSEIADIAVINVPVMGIQSLRGIKYFTSMTALFIHRNNINENEMEHLVRELPEQSGATLYAYYFGASDERNYMNYLQRSAAQAKGWNVLMWQYASEGYAYILPLFDFAPNIIAAYATPEYFPDENFRNALKEQGIGNFYASIPYLTREDVETTKVLDLWNIGITSLTGIQFFTALEELECSNNHLTALDVSKNTKLTKLYCCSNRLTALDVSKNTELTSFDCSWNDLTALDLSKNTELITFSCEENQLTALDVSKNTELEWLNCIWNDLTSLDLSKNTKLNDLICSFNELTTLDVSKNTELKTFYCDYNKISTLDLSRNTNLIYLYCHGNRLTSLDLSKNTKLSSLDCHDNKLTALNFSKNTKLRHLECYSNQIKGTNMDLLIASLPQNNTDDEYKFIVKSNCPWGDYSICTTQQVLDAMHRGWTPFYFDYIDFKEKLFNGSDEVTPMQGDVNVDASVDVADIATVIDVMAGGASSSLKGYADVNNDKTIDVADIASIIDIMARQ